MTTKLNNAACWEDLKTAIKSSLVADEQYHNNKDRDVLVNIQRTMDALETIHTEEVSRETLYRTLIYIEFFDTQWLHVTIPAWKYAEVIALPVSEIPEDILNAIISSGLDHVHAMVNIHAVWAADLTITMWEV